MQIIKSESIENFRAECRDWLADHVPREPRPLEGAAMRDFDRAWQAQQFEGGWAGIAWPKEYGGRGASVLEQLVWNEEYARAQAPHAGSMFVALSHAGPTLINSGDHRQKAFHLPRILRGESAWCQGFSEPSAGSDLASLRCRATLDGDDLIVNGTKIWTSYATQADYQELLVRTGEEGTRHKGISWLICDMKAPGVEIRPIRTMSGPPNFAQVFYNNVRIPRANLVGEMNDGWRVAMTTLGFERGTGMIGHQLELSSTVERLIRALRELPAGEASHSRLAQLRAQTAALRSLTVASVSRAMHSSVPGAEGNIVALHFGELIRDVYQTALDLLGARGLERNAVEDWPFHYLEAFKWAIGGGTSEIRRNAIGERMLGLPKSPLSKSPA